ncbi:hypothetical protein BKA62DRAFT_671980 [Auriculariales sp. MPI-PUGE-AT-0066]|nr:hypothetical protein BKA62DRAFT_671980 [Auriculariales sp. MPI-PUGE-AT-0066]
MTPPALITAAPPTTSSSLAPITAAPPTTSSLAPITATPPTPPPNTPPNSNAQSVQFVSTPQSKRATTTRLATVYAQPVSIKQLELKELILSHLTGRVWEFQQDEISSYEPLVIHLNAALMAAKTIRHQLSFDRGADPYAQNLFFSVYDRETHDHILGAAPLKPDINLHNIRTRTKRPRGKFSASWGHPNSYNKRPMLQIEMAVEVGTKWTELLAQLGTYARASFCASPLRQFVIGIGINHVQQKFCIFIFHAGGVAASALTHLVKGFKHLVRFFLAVLHWNTTEDAGIISDGIQYILPSPIGQTYSCFDNLELLHRRVDLCGRRTYVARVGLHTDGTNEQHGRQTTYFESSGVRPGWPVKEEEENNQPPLEDQTSTTILKRKKNTTSADSGSSKRRRVGDEDVHHESPLERKSARVSNYQAADAASKTLEEEAANVAAQELIRQRCSDERRKTPLAKYDQIIASSKCDKLPTEAVIKLSWLPKDSHEREGLALRDCTGQFGTPAFIYTLCVANNSKFLPNSVDEANPWSEFKRKYDGPILLDLRHLCATISADVGRSLEGCNTPYELARALLDCQLGWLNILQRDILHRDVSIGNLLLLETLVARSRFEPTLPSVYDALVDTTAYTKFNQAKTDLQATLERLGVGNNCSAIITDLDLCTRINQNSEGHSHLSGTTEFMSSPMLLSLESKQLYQQSIRDDIWAFFNVAVWAILHSKGPRGSSAFEAVWRDDIQQNYKTRDSAHIAIVKCWAALLVDEDGEPIGPADGSGVVYPQHESSLDELSPLLKVFLPILHAWHQKLPSQQSPMPVSLAANLQQQFIAIKHVRDFAEILERYRERLEPSRWQPHLLNPV